MSFVSYAQNYEDVILWRVFKSIKEGFYIDVGAAWPNEHSVTKAFYLNGWRGINIEPNPDLYKKLNTYRPDDINLNVAIGERADLISINFINGTGLSTTSESISKLHKENGWSIQKEMVQQIKLSDVCKENIEFGKAIHFLKIDVEGAEEGVLRGHDWNNYRPWVLVIEATLPMGQVSSHESWEPIVLHANYLYAYADGLNRFYVAKEHSELMPYFAYPPNVFDRFILSSHQQALESVEQAEVKTQKAEVALQKAELAVQQAEANAEQTLRQLNDLYSSISWRVTAPLRGVLTVVRNMRLVSSRLNINSVTKNIILYIVRRPKLKQFAMGILRYMPSIKNIIKRIVKVGSMNQSVLMGKEPLSKMRRNVKANSISGISQALESSGALKCQEMERTLISSISKWDLGARVDK